VRVVQPEKEREKMGGGVRGKSILHHERMKILERSPIILPKQSQEEGWVISDFS